MKKRFSGVQIISILRKLEVRVAASEICCKHSISYAVFTPCVRRLVIGNYLK
jgi:hypothetical protein